MRERGSALENTKEILIEQLAEHLDILRKRARLTQEETAKAIGISRQTYCQIENKNGVMSWNVYMALMMLFSNKPETKELLSVLKIEPEKVVDLVVEEACNSKNEIDR